jgi:hypothetical protein
VYVSDPRWHVSVYEDSEYTSWLDKDKLLPVTCPTYAGMQITVGLEQPELKHSLEQCVMLLILFHTSGSRANKSHRLNAGSYLPRLVINLQESIVVRGTKCAATVRPHRLRMYPGHSYVDPTPPHIPIRLEATYLILKK